MKKTLLILVVLMVFNSCQGSSNQGSANVASPSPSPKTTSKPSSAQQESAEAEKDTQDDEDSDNRIAAREAVTEYVKTNLPKLKIEGISLLSYTGNLYIASVDLSDKEKHQTVSLIVRMYVKESGDTYWKADKLSEDDKRLLISRKAFLLKDTERQLIDIQLEKEELENQLEARDSRDDESYEPPEDPRN
jgi:hypothetical protein